jgi:hypothetical protein
LCPVITGLEEFGILADQSPKCSSTIMTSKDEELYARRAKLSKISPLNEDILTRRVRMAKYAKIIRQKKAAVKFQSPTSNLDSQLTFSIGQKDQKRLLPHASHRPKGHDQPYHEPLLPSLPTSGPAAPANFRQLGIGLSPSGQL